MKEPSSTASCIVVHVVGVQIHVHITTVHAIAILGPRSTWYMMYHGAALVLKTAPLCMLYSVAGQLPRAVHGCQIQGGVCKR